MIVVMDHGYATRGGRAGNGPRRRPRAGRRPGGGPQGPSAFERVVMTDLVPAIDARYRTRAIATIARWPAFRWAAVRRSRSTTPISTRSRGSGCSAAPPPPGDLKTAYNGAFANRRRFQQSRASALDRRRQRGGALDDGDSSRRVAARRARHQNVVTFTSEGTSHEWHTWRRCLREFAPKLFKN